MYPSRDVDGYRYRETILAKIMTLESQFIPAYLVRMYTLLQQPVDEPNWEQALELARECSSIQSTLVSSVYPADVTMMIPETARGLHVHADLFVFLYHACKEGSFETASHTLNRIKLVSLRLCFLWLILCDGWIV